MEEVDKGDDLWFNFALSSGGFVRLTGKWVQQNPVRYGQIVRIQWANSTWFEHASELKCLWNDTFCPHNASTELEAWGYCCGFHDDQDDEDM
jgi:hypothetical protein